MAFFSPEDTKIFFDSALAPKIAEGVCTSTKFKSAIGICLER